MGTAGAGTAIADGAGRFAVSTARPWACFASLLLSGAHLAWAEAIPAAATAASANA